MRKRKSFILEQNSPTNCCARKNRGQAAAGGFWGCGWRCCATRRITAAGRESHARQLSISGGELVTAMWLLTTAEFNRVYHSQTNFKERKHGTAWNFLNLLNIRKTIDKVGRVISLNRAEMRWDEMGQKISQITSEYTPSLFACILED